MILLWAICIKYFGVYSPKHQYFNEGNGKTGMCRLPAVQPGVKPLGEVSPSWQATSDPKKYDT